VSRFLDRWDPGVSHADLLLAVTEACSNVVRHAYPDGVGDIRCEVEGVGPEITVRVYDWGSDWNAPPLDPGMGLGTVLMELLADDIRRGRTDDGKVVELRFRSDATRAVEARLQGVDTERRHT
jgi:anti-sigma regulatory factor (Ser/Thr protein kinase)